MAKRDVEITQRKNMGKIIFWAIIVVLIFLSYLIIKPFLLALVSAFILAYLTRPLYLSLSKRLNKPFSAIICIFTVLLIIIIPTVIIIGSIAPQIILAINNHTIDSLLNSLSTSPLIQKTGLDPEQIKNELGNLTLSIFDSILSLVKSAFIYLLSLIIALWGMYYILINWTFLSDYLKRFLPFENKEKLLKEMHELTSGIVQGTLIIAIINFAIISVGFGLLGIKVYLLLAALIAFTTFIPGVGPGAIWIPTAVFEFIQGRYLVALGVFTIGAFVSLVIEFYLKSKLIEKKSKINALIGFIGILGGVPLFGVFGFIIGPLILVFALKLIQEGINQR